MLASFRPLTTLIYNLTCPSLVLFDLCGLPFLGNSLYLFKTTQNLSGIGSATGCMGAMDPTGSKI
jgi:hypothetical protein